MSSQLPNSHFLLPYKGQRPPAPAWFQASLSRVPERSFFQSDGANIELLTWGQIGAPGLLFLHGNGAHADWWSHIAPFFASEWRCAALSYSGMGASDWRREGYTVECFAQEVRDAVAAAKLDAGPLRPIIIGHSFGGMVGMVAASPDMQLRGLVLIDTPIDMPDDRLREIKAAALKSRSEHLVFSTLEDGLARFRLSPQQCGGNDFIGDHIARCALIERAGGWSWRFDPRRIAIDPDRRSGHEILRGLHCPIAYLYGDRSTLVKQEDVARIRRSLGELAPIISIPDAAHHVPIDQPLALVSSLRSLLTCWPPAHDAHLGNRR